MELPRNLNDSYKDVINSELFIVNTAIQDAVWIRFAEERVCSLEKIIKRNLLDSKMSV